MGLFDFFRKHRKVEEKTYNGITFEAPPPISSEEYQRKRQKEIDHLERKYDLTTVAGINAIPTPKCKEPSSGASQSVTGRIEYYLMLKAGGYEKAGETELALACYRKANELMPMSPIAYQYESYMRLPRYLRKLRRFDEARSEEVKINLRFPGDGIFELTECEFMADMKNAGHTKQQAEKLYVDYKADRDAEHRRELCRADYEWLWEFLPKICPKSFSGYMRMRNANTEKFHKIVEEARQHGRAIK